MPHAQKIHSRKPAVAGTFYPADAVQLRKTVRTYLSAATKSCQHNINAPKAIITPHAGYIYSGPVAASVYAQLQPARAHIKRVVLLGPSHHVPFVGLATSSAGVFSTPLGDILLDRNSLNAINKLPQVHCLDEAHQHEHSLEVQLPFLQEVLDNFQLVPLVVGSAEPAQVSEVLRQLWDGPETLIVISSDLSHFHDYDAAQQLDRNTSDAIEALQAETLQSENACGYVPISGLLYLARERGLHVSTIDLRNSFDTAENTAAASRDRVVGYGAYVIN